jgi:hypothetical protein
VIRSTWGADAKRLGVDVKFFVGANASKYESDEIHVDCPDDYNGLPYKTRAICRWASGKVISHIFLCDTDTYVSVTRLLNSGFEQFDYFGYFNSEMFGTKPYTAESRDGVREHHAACYNWASGGLGYSLSKKALSEVAYEHPTSWAEDLWVGQVLGPMIAKNELTVGNSKGKNLSLHYPSAQFGHNYDVEGHKWMRAMHAENA